MSFLLFQPALYRHLGNEELGLWQLLGTSQAFLGLLGFGVAPVLTRHIALAKGRSGAHPDDPLTPETQQHIADLATSGRLLLQAAAVLTFLVALVSGMAVLGTLRLERVSYPEALVAWLVLAAGYSVGVWVSYLDCWLAGVGYVGQSTVVVAVTTVAAMLASVAVLVLGGGMVGLACVQLAGGLLQRWALLLSLRCRRPELLRVAGRWRGDYVRAMARPAAMVWLGALGSFLVFQTYSYFIARFRGLSELPAYNATYQLVNISHQLAITFAVSSAVFLSHAWQAGDRDAVRRLTLRNAQAGMALMAAAVGFILTAGPEFLALWLRRTDVFIGYAAATVFCVMLTLETQHVILSYCARATEDERYAFFALAASAINLGLTWWLIGPYGLLGVALGTMIAQMLTNNWYAVYRPLVRLEIPFGLYLRRVVLLWAVTLAGSLAVAYGLAAHARRIGLGNLGVVAAAAAGAGLCLAAALWWGVLERPHRYKLLHALKPRFSRQPPVPTDP